MGVFRRVRGGRGRVPSEETEASSSATAAAVVEVVVMVAAPNDGIL